MTKSILILNYHQIIRDSGTQNGAISSPFSVKQSDFLNQIKIIKGKNIPIISFQDWKNNNTNAPLSIILTFDDGHKSDYEIVFQTLLQEKVTASFFPILSEINAKQRVNWAQLKEITTSGFTVGSHGVSHKSLPQLHKEESHFELTESKRIIEQNIGQKVDVISLPFGMYNNKLLTVLKEVGYNTALTTRARINTSSKSFLLHRINIKSTTSMNEFEQIISLNNGLMKRKKFISNASFSVNKILGVSLVDSIKEKL